MYTMLGDRSSSPRWYHCNARSASPIPAYASPIGTGSSQMPAGGCSSRSVSLRASTASPTRPKFAAHSAIGCMTKALDNIFITLLHWNTTSERSRLAAYAPDKNQGPIRLLGDNSTSVLPLVIDSSNLLEKSATHTGCTRENG